LGEQELFCGKAHSFILDARECTINHNRSGEEFGDMAEGINLWWGEKFTTGKLNNIGYVIGLRNDRAGIGWRLDYDEKKGAHINQVYRIKGQKKWGKILHLIECGSWNKYAPYGPDFWVMRQWYLWTEHHHDKMPERIAHELTRLGINRFAYKIW